MHYVIIEKVIHCPTKKSVYTSVLTHEYSTDSEPVIIPYKVINIRFITLYGIITALLSAYYLLIYAGVIMPRNTTVTNVTTKMFQIQTCVT